MSDIRPHIPPLFAFDCVRSCANLGIQRGQRLVYAPEDQASTFRIIQHLPTSADEYHARLILENWHRFRLVGQQPAVSEKSAREWLRQTARFQASA